MSLIGHWWTLAPRVAWALQPPRAPDGQAWRLELPEAAPEGATVTLTGRFHAVPGARRAVVLVHGLGGCTESEYMRDAAAEVSAAGWACLRLNLRGSDRRGVDFYHAGLTTDLHAALASPELEPFEDLWILGFSMGGHVTLRAATEEALDRRVRRVAAVCSPLRLGPCAAAIDRPVLWPYRRYLLSALVDIYKGVAERRPVPLPVAEVEGITHIRQWDARVVAPRWGFEDPDDYYARASVGPRLGRLQVPALLVVAEEDPLVPAGAVRPALDGAERLTVRWVSPAGHMGFPRDLELDLGLKPDLERGAAPVPGLVPQVLAWLSQGD